MNREIKFRMWHKKSKKMFDVESINFKDSVLNMWNSIVYTLSTFSLDDVILMQYIGLHDKNGKEIYEGDILKSIQWNDIYLVKHIGTAYYLCRKGKNGFNKITTWNNAEKSEVIGNMYDNPELLGGENGI